MAETIADPFDPANPCRNQCAVTALAVHHHFGGGIIRTATKGGTHFYNLIDGRYWDLATDQFNEPIPYDNTPSSVEEAARDASGRARRRCPGSSRLTPGAPEEPSQTTQV